MGSAATGQLESRARSSCSCLLSQGIVRLVLASWGWWWVPDLLHLHSSMEFGLKLTCCNWAWVGMSSSTDRFKFPKWHLVGWCHHSRKSSSKLLLPVFPFQGGVSVAFTYPGGSPRSAGGSDPCLFQISACVLGLRVCDILYAWLKSDVSASYSLSDFPNRKLSGCQS